MALSHQTAGEERKGLSIREMEGSETWCKIKRGQTRQPPQHPSPTFVLELAVLLH